MNIAVIAPPNGGKGTSWHEIVKKFPQLRQYVCSEHIGELINSDHPDGEEMRRYKDAGQLIPDEIVNRVVFDRLRSLRGPRWQDGFPRTIPQAEAYEKEMGLDDLIIIHFWISDEECVRRSQLRRVCKHCERTQRVTEDGSCEYKCTDETNVQYVRKDDAKIVGRLADYRRDTEPVVEYLMKKGVPVFTVNAGLGTAHVIPQLEMLFKSILAQEPQNCGIH